MKHCINTHCTSREKMFNILQNQHLGPLVPEGDRAGVIPQEVCLLRQEVCARNTFFFNFSLCIFTLLPSFSFVTSYRVSSGLCACLLSGTCTGQNLKGMEIRKNVLLDTYLGIYRIKQIKSRIL